MNSLILHHHAGLGDHFACNGVVNYIVDTTNFDYYYILAKEKNYKTVSEIYSYTDKIRIIPFSDGEEFENKLQHRLPVQGRYVQIGFQYLENYLRENPDKDFSYAFYDQFDLPPSDKWDRFKIQRNYEKEDKAYKEIVGDVEDYIFVHDESKWCGKWDFMIESDLQVIRPDLSLIHISEPTRPY